MKAKEFAYSKYPKEKKGVLYDLARNSIIEGYHQAEKDLMAKAIDVDVHVDASGYPYISQMELYDYDKDIPLAKEGDKYKVVLIKEN